MVGIDITETERFKNINERIFAKSELDYARRFIDPHVHLAGFWSAKEAFLKALGIGITTLNLSEIYVSHSNDGVPVLIVPEDYKEKYGLMDKKIEISISHTPTTAVAVCIII